MKVYVEVKRMNKVIMTGRLTKNPQIKKLQGESNLTVANFTLAVPRMVKSNGEEETDFFHCAAFDRLAAFVEKYLMQGSKILITGKILNNHYVDGDNVKVYGVQIIVDEVEFAESKPKGKQEEIILEESK